MSELMDQFEFEYNQKRDELQIKEMCEEIKTSKLTKILERMENRLNDRIIKEIIE